MQRIKNDGSTLIAKDSTQGTVTVDGTSRSWDGTTGAGAQYYQVQVRAAEGAYINFETTAVNTNFVVDDKFTDLYTSAQFAKMEFLRHTSSGTVVFQGFDA